MLHSTDLVNFCDVFVFALFFPPLLLLNELIVCEHKEVPWNIESILCLYKNITCSKGGYVDVSVRLISGTLKPYRACTRTVLVARVDMWMSVCGSSPEH